MRSHFEPVTARRSGTPASAALAIRRLPTSSTAASTSSLVVGARSTRSRSRSRDEKPYDPAGLHSKTRPTALLHAGGGLQSDACRFFFFETGLCAQRHCAQG